ncbi:MAG: hypothetical protein JWQ87_4536 [Candidatus Sulfotelmatobacter sp.]|nr:hypothetical protein [Candidatus Sulfotelmatobacter sp.]
MKKGHIILTLTLSLYTAGAAWAQGDEPAAPPPAPAFGQESPAPTVSENPPISGIDQPGLEPHAAPESFLLPGLHFSESVDSNVSNTLGTSNVSPVTRGLGSLTLQKLWKNYAVAMDYIGGVVYYDRTGVGLQQLHQFDIDNRISWKRGQLALRDSFSYLPEGTFGFQAYGGSGAYNSSIGGTGSSMLGASAFGGQTSSFYGGSGVSVGEVPRLTNLALADVVENLTPKSSVTLTAGYGIVHFYGNLTSVTGAPANVSFIGSSEETVQFGYDRTLNPKDQIAFSYGYQGFTFSTVGTAMHSHVLQAMYGHRISGRMDFTISAGPQFTHISDVATVCTFFGFPVNVPTTDCLALGGTFVVFPQSSNQISAAGRVSLRYRFPKTSVSLEYSRFNTSGSGLFAGSRSDTAVANAQRPLTRIWDVFGDVGYSRNSRLQAGGSSVAANNFSYIYAGVGLHRQFGRTLKGYVSYQFNDLSFDSACPVPATAVSSGTCSNRSQRHVGSIGLDWTPRPIRLD